MRYLLTILIISFFISACSSSEGFERNELDFLLPGESFVDIKINNASFYADTNQFIGNLTVGNSSIRGSFSDTGMSNIQLELTKNNLLSAIEAPIMISTNPQGEYNNYGNLLLGKKQEDGFKGYMLSRGSFNWKVWSKEFAVLHCEGFVISPGQAMISENEISFEGSIYFKSPTITTDGIKESEVF